MTGLVPAVLAGLLTFGLGAMVSRWLGVSKRAWLPGGLVLSVVVAALAYWAFRPE